MGFLEFLAAGAAPEAAAADDYPDGAVRWSDPDTWGGKLPARGEAVTVDVGRTLIIDQDLDVGSLHIKGTAIVERRDISIGAEWILVEGAGALIAGSAEQPFKQRLHITLCSSASEQSASAHPQLGSKFLAAINGGTIDLHGEARTSWVPLGNSTAPGHNTLRLAQPVDWRAGERIAIASGADHCLLEERAIDDVGADCLTVRLATPVWHRHHGKHAPLRHVLPGSIGKVVLLSRNIVIEGCADSERNSVGAYCLIAGTADKPRAPFDRPLFRRRVPPHGSIQPPRPLPAALARQWRCRRQLGRRLPDSSVLSAWHRDGGLAPRSHQRQRGDEAVWPRLYRRERRQLAAAGDDEPGVAPARGALRRSKNAQLLRASAARILDRAVRRRAHCRSVGTSHSATPRIIRPGAAAGAACRRKTN